MIVYGKSKLLLGSMLILFIAIPRLIDAYVVYDDSFDVDDDENPEENLLTKIECKVGDKYDYVMVTQSSLFDQSDANLQVKAVIELKCLNKQKWYNKTSRVYRNGQLYEAQIKSVHPIHLPAQNSDSVNIKSARLQMASLFASLNSMNTNSGNKNSANGNRNRHNIKLGAVDSFFGEMADKFGKWIAEMFQKIVRFFEQLINKKKSTSVKVGASLNCDSDEKDRRHKRQSFNTINFEQFSDNFKEMFKHPFQFLQLEDGSIQNIQLSDEESNPNVYIFKKFLSNAFATQLDERKRTVLEESEFGTHLSHYQMEYDEPDREKVTPEEYMSNMYNKSKRSVDSHLVSVIKSVQRKDVISGHNQMRQGTGAISKIDFSVQQVQLIRGNMLVASGGYFQSLFPGDGNSKQRTTRDTTNSGQHFDSVFQKYLNFDMQYSMVKIGKYRWKRSSEQFNIDYVEKLEIIFKKILTGHRVNKRQVKSDVDNVVCGTFVTKTNSLETNEIIDDDNVANVFDECYEYKQFGSDLFNAYFNKSVIASHDRTRLGDNFISKYRVGAKLMGEDIFLGKIDLSKNKEKSKFNVNLFGSEYVDLDLCEVKDRVFSQSNSIPLFTENIWFMTNVGIQLRYKLDFQFKLPKLVCSSPNNTHEKITADQLQIDQNTAVELGAVFDASFLIFSGNMNLSGNFDMDSMVDYSGSCLSARSLVKPMNVSLGFNYQFYHPLCKKWMEDSWLPKRLSLKLNREYRNTWLHNACV